MKFVAAAVTAALMANTALAFQAPVRVVHRTSSRIFADPSELSNNMAKVDDDTRKAIKQVEEQKNGEIQVRLVERMTNSA